MALLDSLFGKSDPTRDWTRDPGLVLLLDLDSHALCGARLGEPLERLRGLGPAEDRRAARRESFRYLSRGLEVDSESGALHGFVLVFKDDLREGFQPFQGRLRFREKPIHLSGSSTEKDLVERFGQPYWRDEDRDEGEILLFYEWDGVEWQFELSQEGKLKALLLVAPPLLADEEQRRAYRVQKSWPR